MSAKKLKSFVLTETYTYWYDAPSLEKAKELAAIPQAIPNASKDLERTLTCENTGEEIPLHGGSPGEEGP